LRLELSCVEPDEEDWLHSSIRETLSMLYLQDILQS
jgi:hypothetical protein